MADHSSDRSEPSAAPRQEVRAEGGFAYGCVGADIHVFGDGVPVYLLKRWEPPPRADSEWLREQPSRMLNARFAVVDFALRDDEVAALEQWRDEGGRLAARWLHGPGGQGKTRLADEFAARSAARGWKVIVAIHGPGSVLPPPGSQDMRPGDAAGLLVIVDYADRWHDAHLAWLLSNSLFHQSAVRTRVLFLARTAHSWPAVRARLADLQAGTSSQPLAALRPDGPSTPDGGQRARMFHAARDGFAGRYGLSSGGEVRTPGNLSHPDFGLTLAIHMAALVAVDAHVEGRRRPEGLAGLTLYLLDREHANWARRYGDPAHQLGRDDRGYRTPPQIMNRAVFTAALTGPSAPAAARSAVTAVGLGPDPDPLLTDHAACYPPADHTRETLLEPLYPDRLAEDFLALTIPGHRADYPAQSWATATSAALLSRAREQGAQAWTTRSVIVLAAAAERWPHVGDQHLYPLLAQDPQLAIDAGSAGLTALAHLEDITPALLEEIAACIPDQRDVGLDTGIAHLTARLSAHRLARTTDPVERCRIHLDLSNRYADAGMRQESMGAGLDALKLVRPLAVVDPDTFEPELARTLTNLGASLDQAGRRQEALQALSEARDIRRRLADGDFPAFAAGLATTLVNLAACLSGAGQREPALRTTQEAVALLRRLEGSEQSVALANALTNLNQDLLDTGEPAAAREAAREAATRYRALAATAPAAHSHSLATALANLGRTLAQSGRYEEAAGVTEEAIGLYQDLAGTNPAAFEPYLARALTNHSVTMTELGRKEAALASAEESVGILRRLAAGDPRIFQPDLARALTTYGQALARARRWAAAEAVTQESIALFRSLAADQPDGFDEQLARALLNHGAFTSRHGPPDRSLSLVREAVTRYRRLAALNPLLGRELAQGLSCSAQLLAKTGATDEALAASEEALGVVLGLVQAEPDVFEASLADTLFGFALLRHECGRELDEALHAAGRALALYSEQAEGRPAHAERVWGAVTLTVALLEHLGRTAEAAALRRRLGLPATP